MIDSQKKKKKKKKKREKKKKRKKQKQNKNYDNYKSLIFFFFTENYRNSLNIKHQEIKPIELVDTFNSLFKR